MSGIGAGAGSLSDDAGPDVGDGINEECHSPGLR
jgi:hypothetical protein